MFSGKNLAYTRVDFTNESGDLVAYGSERFLSDIHTTSDGNSTQPIPSTWANRHRTR